MRFLVDMPVTPRAVEFLAERGHEALHASTIGLSEASDTVILERARAEDRVVVTADLDYPRLLATHGGSSPGVVLVRHGNLTDDEMLGRLGRVLDQIPPAELGASITVVESTRIRTRKLPIG